MTAIVHAEWDLTPNVSHRVEVVHRMSHLGAVVTHTAHGTSQEGFEAEWRVINLLTVDGDLLSRVEIFDDTDIDAALARFDELSRPAPALENAASQVAERFNTCFVAEIGTRWRRHLLSTISRTIAVGWWARESVPVETLKLRTCRQSQTSGPAT